MYHEKKMMLHLLSSCHVAKFAVRLVLINPKNCIGLTTVERHLHYHCLNVLQYVTDERYIEDKNERVKNFKFAQEYEAIPCIVNFLDPNVGTPLTMVHASAILKQFVSDNEEASALVRQAGGLNKCLYLMARKRCEKMFMDYYRDKYLSKSGIDKDEAEIIEKFYSGKKTILKRLEGYPRLTESDYRKECFMYMAHDLQLNCALVVYKLVSTDKFNRREIFMSHSFSQALNKWLWTPCIWRTERSMMHFCFNILRGVVEDAHPSIMSRDLLKHYNVLELIEDQIYNPDKDILIGVLNLLGVFSRQYPECIHRIAGNRTFTNAVAIYVNSFDDQIQIGALQTLCTFTQFHSTAAMVLDLGVTAEKMNLLSKYNIDQVTEVFKQMKILMQQSCPSEWRKSEQAFKRVSVDKKYSLEKALKHKEEGNAKFKEENYEAALKCYTLGLECVPPVENFRKESQQRKTNWFVLPSVLFTNRAQCYLTMKKWHEAIADCTQAICRSFEENEEAKKILHKTVYRRARAFVEIKNYRNALNDVSFCLQKNLPATIVRALFREVLTEYRKRYGIEPLRRCGACMDGLGTKLKRCAKCPEVYCSRACQAYAWDEGHKNLCNYTLEKSD